MDRPQQTKCHASPSDCICGDGAHHWWIYGRGANPQAYCVHCGRGRTFQAVFGARLFDYGEQKAHDIRAQAKEAALHTSYDDYGKL
jgi:hypothetical protein